jgi:hypothetical protein
MLASADQAQMRAGSTTATNLLARECSMFVQRML